MHRTDSPEPTQRRPLLDMTRDGNGRLTVGITTFGPDGYGLRSTVLARQSIEADVVMFRRMDYLAELIGADVEYGPDADPSTARPYVAPTT